MEIEEYLYCAFCSTQTANKLVFSYIIKIENKYQELTVLIYIVWLVAFVDWQKQGSAKDIGHQGGPFCSVRLITRAMHSLLQIITPLCIKEVGGT